MLKGHVFSKQLFENPIFALFINTFTNGKNGVSDNYKNGMQITYSGSNITINNGVVCIQGRFLEEDTSTTINVGTNTAYCKLVIEIDLDKQNTESDFQQGKYKIITSTSGYPTLTQTNIVKNVSGIYQYELARFRTTASGITNFQDMRTFLDLDTIYEQIEKEYRAILEQLQEELEGVKDGSAFLLKTGGIVNGNLKVTGNLTNNNNQKYLNVGDIAFVTGDIIVKCNSGDTIQRGVASVAYPSGFNKNNCIVISFATQQREYDDGFWTYGYNTDSTTLLTGEMLRTVKLDSNIVVKLNHFWDAPLDSARQDTFTYRIALLKIS